MKMTLSCKAKAFSVVNLLRLPVDTAHSGYDTKQPRDAGLLDMKSNNAVIRSALADGHSEDMISNGTECELGKEFQRPVGCISGVPADVPRNEQLLRRRLGSDSLRHRHPSKARYLGNERKSHPVENGRAHLCRKQRPGSKSERLRQGSSTDVCGTTCFCHGEIMYCQHPSLQSVTDANGSGLSALVELCHSDLWSSFHRLGTEMIITKSGRRMFPVLKLRVSGLSRDKMYSVRLEFCQPDTRKYRYIYNNSRWMVSGTGDALAAKPCHFIQEGPLSGQALCSQILSFERLKMTNSECTKPSQVSLVSMQKFQPQIVIDEVPGPLSVVSAEPEHYLVMFPQTSFMAVTAYQNQQITTLKIASNPFAKGFRESGKARVTFETLAAQYSGFVPQKSFSPELATSAPLMPGSFRRGMPDTSCKYSQMEDETLLQIVHQPMTTLSTFNCYPLYYPPFSPSFLFKSQGKKCSSFENSDSCSDNRPALFLHTPIDSNNTMEHSRSLISSPLNLAVTPYGESEKLERTKNGHFDDKVLQTCYQYRYHSKEFLSVKNSITSKQRIAMLHPYGQFYSDSNSPFRFTSDQQETLEARASGSNMLSQDATRSHSARLSRSSSRELLMGPSRRNTEPSATSHLPIIKHIGYEV